ncbi:hypothetical protein KJ742_06725 [Patescibacteria group bacterium]|nr:hypothetical protein [Patescibacteria group bacterium]MBU1683606.1 hypothetical protein [Patescibacteria group bacterium]
MPEVYDPDVNHNKVLLEWKTPEFIPVPRTPKWYLMAGVLVVSLVAYAIFTGSATMAIVFILLGGMFFLTHRKMPRIVDVKITELGVEYDNKFYHYNTINAFWIVYHPPYVRTLYFRLGGKVFRHIKIELNHQNPIELRKFLTKEIPEIEGEEERLTDTLSRLFRLQ